MHPASNPDREIPSGLGTPQIKCAKRLNSHELLLHTLHHAIYYTSLFLAARKPPISHLNKRRGFMPLLRERRKQGLSYSSLGPPQAVLCFPEKLRDGWHR